MIDPMRLSLTLAIIYMSSLFMQAQIPIIWSQNLGNAQTNIIVDVVDIPAGGCLTVGYSSISSTMYADLWLTRYSNNGTMTWTKDIGSTGFEKASAAAMLSDGNIVLVGHGCLSDGLSIGTSKDADGIIIKIDQTGNILWTRTFGGLGYDKFNDVVALPNGDCVVVGTTSSFDNDYSERATGGWAVRINSSGGTVWNNNYGGSLMDSYARIIRNSDGSLLAGGTSNSRDMQSADAFGANDIWVSKLNANGSHAWSRNYGGAANDELNSLAHTSDGGYIIGATTYSSFPDSKGHGDIWVLKISALGNQIWQKIIGGSATDKCTDIQPFEDDGFLLSTSTMSIDGDINSALGGQDAWLIKLSAIGNLEWQSILGGSKNDAINAVEISSDGSVWLGGYSFSSDGQLSANLGKQDGWLMRSSVDLPPTISLGEDIDICIGAEIMLDATVPNCNSCTYLWDDGSTLAVRTIIINQSSTFSVTATDNTGDTSIDAIGITAIPVISATPTIQNVSCADEEDGSIFLNTTGGTGNYVYNWSNGDLDNANTGLVANTYFVTISDEALCEFTDSYSLTNPLAIAVDADIELPSCSNSSLGSISLTTSGGESPYDFVWSNQFIGPIISGLDPGEYTVTITDALNCEYIETYILSNDVTIIIVADVQNVSCHGASDGAINLTVTGDFPPFSFDWDNGFSSNTLIGLPAGEYTVTITDAQNCQSISKFSITQPDQFSVSVVQNNTQPNQDQGSLQLNIAGGIPPYQVTWSHGESGLFIDNLAAGFYTATITDSNECELIITYEILTTVSTSSTAVRPLNVYPNPSLGLIYIEPPVGLHTPNSVILLYDVQGRTVPFTTGPSASGQLFLELDDYVPGLYILDIRTASATYQSKIILL